MLIVAQGFKEGFAAAEVATACSEAARALGAEPRVVLASDGGEGLLDALEREFTCKKRYEASGPLGARVEAAVGWLDRSTAVVETRLFCGLSVVAEEDRDPLRATTRGVGEVVDQLIDDGASTVYLGLGGSATMDGGVGMARAWGWRPLGLDDRELPDGGGSLADLEAIVPGRRPAARLIGLADVRNPMIGPRGSRLYATQKGASAEAEERLVRGLDCLAAIADREGWGELASWRGAGAAGGLGFGIMFFGGGSIEPGAPWVLDRTPFDDLLTESAVVVTGEGCFDATSTDGKLTGEVIARARRARVPAVVLAPGAEVETREVLLESGGGVWDREELGRRAVQGLRRALGC